MSGYDRPLKSVALGFSIVDGPCTEILYPYVVILGPEHEMIEFRFESDQK